MINLTGKVNSLLSRQDPLSIWTSLFEFPAGTGLFFKTLYASILPYYLRITSQYFVTHHMLYTPHPDHLGSKQKHLQVIYTLHDQSRYRLYSDYRR